MTAVRAIFVGLCVWAVANTHAAKAQCYRFTSGSSTLDVSLGSLPAPSISTTAGLTTYTYELGGRSGNAVKLTVDGITSTATVFPSFQVLVVTGSEIAPPEVPAQHVTHILITLGSAADGKEARGLGASVTLTNRTDNLLPTGRLPMAIPPTPSWEETFYSAVIYSGGAVQRSVQAKVDFIGGCSISVPPGECSITSETLAKVPNTPDSRTTLGVGEWVKLTTDNPVTWNRAQGKAVLSGPAIGKLGSQQCPDPRTSPPRPGREVCLTAPFSTDQTEITAALADGGSCAKKFKTIQPSGLIFQRLTSPGYAYKDNTNTKLSNTDVIGYWDAYFLLPGTVSFANIGIAEQDQPIDADNHIGARYPNPPLVAFQDKTAWFAGCDMIVEPRNSGGRAPISPWAYTWGSNEYVTANKAQFASVVTKLIYSQGIWRYQKGQVNPSKLIPNVILPFIEPFAAIAIQDSASNSIVGKLDYTSCLDAVRKQFGPRIMK